MIELTRPQARRSILIKQGLLGSHRFRGKEVVVISNSILETSETGTGTVTRKAPMYIGSMSDYLAFFERKGVEVMASDEAGFEKNSVIIRAIERFGLTACDTAALKAYTITKS